MVYKCLAKLIRENLIQKLGMEKNTRVWIEVYDTTKNLVGWLKFNYREADRLFRELHHGIKLESEEVSWSSTRQHGITEILRVHEADKIWNWRTLIPKFVRRKEQKREIKWELYWSIGCHEDNGAHVQKTRDNIETILKRLGSLENIKIEVKKKEI